MNERQVSESPTVARLLDVARDAALGLVSVLVGVALIGPVGLVAGPIAAAILGSLWRSRSAVLAEREQASLATQLAELTAQVGRPEKSWERAERVRRDVAKARELEKYFGRRGQR